VVVPAFVTVYFLYFIAVGVFLGSAPWGGPTTTGAVAEILGRRWIAVENVAEYLDASRFRFD
jgi:site-specific DNA-methyltransferase (cytosine-N4-specific)